MVKNKIISGLLWTALSTFITKILSFGNQIALGYILEPQIYGVFAIIASSMIFVNVFQNSGISKVLISDSESFSSNISSYSAFNFTFSILGMMILIILGLVNEKIKDIDGIFFVYLITAFSIPILSLCSLFIAKLSVNFNFKKINVILVCHTAFYYISMIFIAFYGGGYYTIAIATFSGSILQLYLLYKYTPRLKIKYITHIMEFFSFIKKFRWVLLTGFFGAIALRVDFFVLSSLLNLNDLGYYYFGLMLIMSVTVLISSSINQVLLPIFSKLKGEPGELRRKFIFISSGICFLSAIICILLITLGPAIINTVWSGKWNGAIPVVIICSIFIPIRMMSALSYTVFESHSLWRKRLGLSILEVAILVILVWIGAKYNGLIGACIGIAVQRIFLANISYYLSFRVLDLYLIDFVKFNIITFSPYFLSLISLYIMKGSLLNINISFGLETFVISFFSLIILFVFGFLLNKNSILNILKYRL